MIDFDQPALALEDVQFQFGVAEGEQRLAGRHHVAAARHHLLDLTALLGVEVDDIVRHHLASQRRQVVEHAPLDGVDGHAGRRHAHAALPGPQDARGEIGEDGQSEDHPDAQPDPPASPSRPGNRPIHVRAHLHPPSH